MEKVEIDQPNWSKTQKFSLDSNNTRNKNLTDFWVKETSEDFRKKFPRLAENVPSKLPSPSKNMATKWLT